MNEVSYKYNTKITITTFPATSIGQEDNSSSLSISTLLSNLDDVPLWFVNVPQWYTIVMTFILAAFAISTILSCLTVFALIKYFCKKALRVHI